MRWVQTSRWPEDDCLFECVRNYNYIDYKINIINIKVRILVLQLIKKVD